LIHYSITFSISSPCRRRETQTFGVWLTQSGGQWDLPEDVGSNGLIHANFCREEMRGTMNAKTATVLGLGLGILAASAAHASVLYSQPDNGVGGWLSATGQDAMAYDDFTLAGGGTITTVDWSGIFLYTEGPDVTGFTVNFWSYAAGTPRALLASYNFGGSTGQTYAGFDPSGLQLYNWSETLNVPFAAAPGTEYFLSIVEDAPATAWYWKTSAAGDNGGYENAGPAYATGQNLAFTLESIPEPSTMALLLGTAFTALGLAGRMPRPSRPNQ
jgi:hypothetical protein